MSVISIEAGINASETNASFAQTIQVSLDSASVGTTTVDYAFTPGTATAADFSGTNGTLTFLNGETTKNITVTITGDLLDEFDEAFTVTLSNPSSGNTLGLAIAAVTIFDDDAAPTISVSDPSITEGGQLQYNVTLSAASGKIVTVFAETGDGTAASPGDFGSGNVTLTYNPGDTAIGVLVNTNADDGFEADETVFLNLTLPTNATIADAQGVGTIIDNDGVSIADVSVNENAGTVTITATRESVSASDTTVVFSTTDGTAIGPNDYTVTAGSITIKAGDLTGTGTITIADDFLDEDDETFAVSLTSSVGGGITDGTAVVTILDNDLPPTLIIADVSVTEGGFMTFNYSLSGASGKSIQLSFTLADGTATQPSDYSGGGAGTTILAGTTAGFVGFSSNADTLFEADETVLLNITSTTPGNVDLGDAVAVGTIKNDDAMPSLTIGDVKVNEAAGTVTLKVTQSAVSGLNTTFTYDTVSGTATNNADYTGTPVPVSVTIPAGQTEATFAVAITNDLLDEIDEKFTVKIASPTNATISDSTGVVTITDDDPAPTISISDPTVTEGGLLAFVVSLSAPSGKIVTVAGTTAADTATTPSDYLPIVFPTFLPITFLPGNTSVTVLVPTIPDISFEPDETVFFNLSSPNNATIADKQGIGTIIDNDGLSIADVTVNEAAGTATITITRESVSLVATKVNYTTSSGTAVQPADYTLTSGTATIAALQLTTTFTVPINSDLLDEDDETFTVTLSSPTGAGITDGTAVVTITDDDAPPTISVADASITEGGVLTFNVSLSAPSGKTITAFVKTANGSAISPTDYTSGDVLLTFNPGQTLIGVLVSTIGDTDFETNETMVLSLSLPANVTVADALGLGTIINDDPNTAPSGSDATVLLAPTQFYTFSLADFGFTDPDGNQFKSVIFPSVPNVPELLLNGVPVIAGQEVPVALIQAGQLTYDLSSRIRFEQIPVVFQVRDDGGTATGGFDIDQSPNTITLQIVVPVTGNTEPFTQDDKTTTPGDVALNIAGSVLTANDTDPDGDTLKIVQVSDAVGGTVSLSSGNVLFTPNAGFTGAGSFSYLVSDDRGGSATGRVAVTVTAPLTPPNTPPVTAPAQALFTLAGVPVALKVSATDANGNTLSFAAGDPLKGSVTGGSGGAFVYNPDAGQTGPDSFGVTVSDGKGGSANQIVTVTSVNLAAADDWKLFADDGWVGEVGGNGQVFGTSAYQEVAVFNVPGHVQFDPSFNRGGDLICPKGVAADWKVYSQGSNAIFFDGDTMVTIPVGTAGMAVFFEDGGRLLKIDASTGTMTIGSQVIDGTLRTVSAVPDGTPHPEGTDTSAVSKLFLAEGGEAWLGGDTQVFGTNSPETLWTYFGDISLDASFARGGDQVFVAAGLRTTEASRTGASVLLSGGDVDLSLTAGTGGTSLVFWDATKALLLDADAGSVSIGAQMITSSSALLTFA